MRVLVVVLNRCRLDYLGCYGCDWVATPTLDNLAAESVVFDQHFTERASVLGARWEWLSGTSSRQVGLAQPESWLLPALWDQGVHTTFIADSKSGTLGTAFAEGWESQQWIRPARLEELEQDSLLGGTVQTAIEWLQARGASDDWLLWLELAGTTPPWLPTEHDAEAILEELDSPVEPWFDAGDRETKNEQEQTRLEHTYAGIVGGVDQWLGMLLDFLRSSGLLDQVQLIVTSDLGLALGDRGYAGDAHPSLHEEQVHLPLMFRQAGFQARRVHQFTQPVDLHATVAESFGLEQPQLSGRSLRAMAQGAAFKARDYLVSSLRHGKEQRCWSIRTHQWYCVLPTEAGKPPQLFIKPEDRWEVNDVASQHPAVTEHLELVLRRHLDQLRQGVTVPVVELRDDVLKILQ